MRYINQSKPIKFSLVVGGKECRNVDEVKQSFNVDSKRMPYVFGSLWDSYSNGNLRKWIVQIQKTDYLETMDNRVLCCNDDLEKKLILFNMFASKPLPFDTIGNECVMAMLTHEIINYSELQGTQFAELLEIKKTAIPFIDNGMLNELCANDFDLLTYYYETHSYKNLNESNVVTLYKKQQVSNAVFLEILKTGIVGNVAFNKLCEDNVQLLIDYYTKEKSCNKLNNKNISTLINKQIITDENLTIKISDEDNVVIEMVKVENFYIGKFLVTETQWYAVMGGNSKQSNLPVVNISYYDIVNDFLPKLNMLTGQNFRLPTNDEWCSAFDPAANKYSGSDYLDSVGWSRFNSHNERHPVGTKNSNGYGIYDMSGNVAEWVCARESADETCVRGGDYLSYAEKCRVDSYDIQKLNYKDGYTGFRLALSFDKEVKQSLSVKKTIEASLATETGHKIVESYRKLFQGFWYF